MLGFGQEKSTFFIYRQIVVLMVIFPILYTPILCKFEFWYGWAYWFNAGWGLSHEIINTVPIKLNYLNPQEILELLKLGGGRW